MHCFEPLNPAVFLERTGKVFSDRIALSTLPGAHSEGAVLTYGELLNRSRRLMCALHRLGVEHGDRVALLSENAPQVIEAHFGIPGAGAVITSINPWLPTAEIGAQLRFAGCRVLIASAACLQRHAELQCSKEWRTLVFGAQASQGASLDYERELAAADAHATLHEAVHDEMGPITLNFTSGTTGTPKGVLMSHRGAYLHALGQVLMLGLAQHARYLWTLPMFHVSGWGHIWANVAVGATQLLAELPGESADEGARFASQLREHQISHMAGAPRLIRRLSETSAIGDALSGCTIVTGGAAPSTQLLKQLEALGVRLIHQYGLNETSGPYVVCEEQARWSREDADTRALRRSRQGVAGIHVGTGLRVVDGDGCDVPADGKTTGEVIMAGNTVALGYYANPEATAKAFVDGWFRTGDVAVVHDDGYLQITDRIKDLIYVETEYGWENISSIEIENVLQQCVGVRDVAVIGLKVEEGQEGATLVAFVEASPPLGASELHAFCARELPAHKRPQRFLFESIPKTATGKTRKDLLSARARREVDR